MCDLSRLIENLLISPVAAAILSGDDVGVSHTAVTKVRSHVLCRRTRTLSSIRCENVSMVANGKGNSRLNPVLLWYPRLTLAG